MGFDYAFPRSAKIGGMASGGQTPGSNALYLGDATYNDGVVGVALHGDVAVDTIVAQGCRPIGRRMQITSSESNILLELDGRNTMDVLRELFQNLDERDSQLAQHSLFLGVVMDEFNDDPKLGDFLIRNIIGLDARRGALAVGEHLKEGQTVQFHLRDAETSSQDLDAMLTQYTADGVQASGRGRAAVPVPGTRLIPLRAPRPRHRYVQRQGRRDPAYGFFLQRRDRPDRGLDIPARLHELVRHLQVEDIRVTAPY